MFPFFQNSHKFSRKRPSAKYHGENEKTSWLINNNAEPEREEEECNPAESGTKYKKNSEEANTKGAQLIEALTQKYELTYYNSNNSNSFKGTYNNNNNNSNLNNNNTNNNNNEFWHMARLCMQRPVNYEQTQKIQQQPEHQNNHQKLSRLPTFYYRQQQFILTPGEQQQQQQQQLYSSHTLPASQQVYLKLQQNLQAVQTTQNSVNDEEPHSTNPTSSNLERVAYINIRGNSNDTASKHT